MKRSRYARAYGQAPTLQIPLWLVGVLLLGLWGFAGWQDFVEARRADCAQASGTYNPETDHCEKEAQNGKTP